MEETVIRQKWLFTPDDIKNTITNITIEDKFIYFDIETSMKLLDYESVWHKHLCD